MRVDHNHNLLHSISYSHDRRMQKFLELDLGQQATVLVNLTKHIQREIVTELSHEQLVKILEYLDPDEDTLLLRLLPESQRQKIVSQLSENLRHHVSELLKFDPETAAGLMNIDYIQVQQTDSIGAVAQQVKVHEDRTGKVPTILVVEQGRLVGAMEISKLGFAKPEDTVMEFISTVPTIKFNARHDEVMDHFRHHPHSKVIVVGEDQQVLGVIYTDDILRVIQARESRSLYDFAGVSNEESIYDPFQRKIAFRRKWLNLNLVTAFLAAFTISLFSGVISKNVVLAFYMPVVAGMGGNAATQTLAVMVRGLSLHNLDTNHVLQTLRNEQITALVNGLINGSLVALVVYLLNRDLTVGVILGIALVLNLQVAALFGTIVPVLLKKSGKDPASSASIFITTATDVLGFMAFLGLASVILK